MGFLHIYCGEGKGKTTAALGLALRAAGAGKTVRIIQLLKGTNTSELESLRMIPNITVTRCDKNYGFVNKMTEADKAEITACHNRLLSEGYALVRNGAVDMLIIDEFNAAYDYNLFDRKTAEEFLSRREFPTEVVITGRNPADFFLNIADYISEVKCVKHPYEKGVSARKGIEY
ncbi:MAG: cob(I)yrinic acid a,c-diamide adenosyltransferase [Oscillospiraceae bacterium]|nr:cob(I)yrinic acid a,c-diamide adenosyltransferase [Oscillospiraceae bacterium]